MALASRCASYGMTVIICDNNTSNLSSAKSAIKGKVETVEMDVSKVEDFEKLKSKVEKEFNGTITSSSISFRAPLLHFKVFQPNVERKDKRDLELIKHTINRQN